jgi:hypothetical protein
LQQLTSPLPKHRTYIPPGKPNKNHLQNPTKPVAKKLFQAMNQNIIATTMKVRAPYSSTA